MTDRPATWSAATRLRSFRCAIRGVGFVMTTQPHARVHAVATLLVVAAAAFLHVDRVDWVMLIGAMAMVWTAEALNTAVEFACDAVIREHQPLIGKAKDAAAGAVLLAAVGAAVIGALVFVPRFL